MALYPTLPTASSIRVLILHSGDDGADLRASFKVVDLDSLHLEYEAISYYWGPPVFPRHIEVNGKQQSITQTLFDALIRLRLPESDRVLWADAVCINQASNDERSHQVGLMKRIYSQCKQCVIYLGPEADDSELVPDFSWLLLVWLAEVADSPSPHDHKSAVLTSWEQTGLPATSDVRWTALSTLLRRPWFSRLWCVQEFALPNTIVTVCGDWQLDGTVLPQLVWGLTSIVPGIELLKGQNGKAEEPQEDDAENWTYAINGAIHSLTIRSSHLYVSEQASLHQAPENGPRRPHENLMMHRLLWQTPFCKVSDPRDAFYGLLGLARDLDDHPDLRPDYNKTFDEVRNAYFALFLRQGHGYQLLAHARYYSSLTSYAPSWMGVGERLSVHLNSAVLPEQEFGKDLERRGASVSSLSHDEVAVKGWLIDQIRYQTDICYEGNDAEFLQAVMVILSGKLGLTAGWNSKDWDSNKSGDSKGAESWKRLVLRVLCQNRTGEATNTDINTLLDAGTRYFNILDGTNDVMSLFDLSNGTSSGLPKDYLEVRDGFTKSENARFGATKAGCFGMFPPSAMPGDEVFMIDGTSETFLVRAQPDTHTYRWLGEIYVDSFEEQIRKAMSSGGPKTIVLR